VQSPYQNVAWTASEWRELLDEGTRVLRKGGRQLIFCSNTLRRELEALVDSEKSLKMDCPYVWERAGNMLTWADRAQFHYREPALEFVLVIQQRHEVAAGTLAQSAQGASRILGQFGRPEGASVKHPDLYRELLSRYEPGVVLDYCMSTGVCGTIALQLGHRFLGVELVPDIYFLRRLLILDRRARLRSKFTRTAKLHIFLNIWINWMLNPQDVRAIWQANARAARAGFVRARSRALQLPGSRRLATQLFDVREA